MNKSEDYNNNKNIISIIRNNNNICSPLCSESAFLDTMFDCIIIIIIVVHRVYLSLFVCMYVRVIACIQCLLYIHTQHTTNYDQIDLSLKSVSQLDHHHYHQIIDRSIDRSQYIYMAQLYSFSIQNKRHSP